MTYYLANIWKADISEMSENELWEHYEQCLKQHDWTFDFSDSLEIWNRGKEQWAHLSAVRSKCQQLDKERADQLFYKHSFWYNEDGSLKEF